MARIRLCHACVAAPLRRGCAQHDSIASRSERGRAHAARKSALECAPRLRDTRFVLGRATATCSAVLCSVSGSSWGAARCRACVRWGPLDRGAKGAYDYRMCTLCRSRRGVCAAYVVAALTRRARTPLVGVRVRIVLSRTCARPRGVLMMRAHCSRATESPFQTTPLSSGDMERCAGQITLFQTTPLSSGDMERCAGL